MRFSTILFDWGDTLAPIKEGGVVLEYAWVEKMIPALYENGYRLGIISNTHRYQDAHHIRNNLQSHKLLAYFEMIISSATYAVHKPDPRIFQKAIDFMQINPAKTLMVGDSEHADGAAQFFGMNFLHVQRGEVWDKRLYKKLREELHPRRRVLTNLYEFNLVGDQVITRLRHLSDPIQVGSLLLLNDREVEVTEMTRTITKPEILKTESYISFRVRSTDGNPL